MIEVKKHGIALSKTDLGFEDEGVLNPAVIKVGDTIHMFYRAVAKGNYSTIGYATFSDPLTLQMRGEVPILFPQLDYENHGVEDPRIVKIDDIFFLTYTAYDGSNALGALAISNDLVNFEKKGIITPQILYEDFERLASVKKHLNEKYERYNKQGRFGEIAHKKILLWNKDVMFFPRRIKGKFYLLHRIKPDIQLVGFHNLEELTPEFWQNYLLHFDSCIVLAPKYEHEISYIGGGCPPIETEHGWLLIYHGVHDTVEGYVYVACAALLDLDNPEIELARLPYPLFKPGEDWEKIGYVNNVCFPTGAVLEGDTLFIYYGAADAHIACASLSLSELLKELNALKVDGNDLEKSHSPDIKQHS